MNTAFAKLNVNWNAESSAPDPQVIRDGSTVRLRFFLDPFQFPQFNEEDIGVLRFTSCWRYSLVPPTTKGGARNNVDLAKLRLLGVSTTK